jgi:hypothetical protein
MPSSPTSAKPWLARVSPLLKLTLWLAFTLAATVLVQFVAWILRLQPNLFDDSARHALLPIALIALAVLAIFERRPAADYGLAIPAHWQRQLQFGVWLGVLSALAYFTAAWLAGAVGWPGTATWSDWLDPFWIVPVAFIIAIVQQVILSGYFLAIFRERFGPIVAVIATALIFPLLFRVAAPNRMLEGRGWREELGLLLLQALLATIRLATGNILLSGGLLAGILIVLRIIEQTHLLDVVKDSPFMPWLVYHGDPRQSPVFWMLIALALPVAAVAAARRREPDSTAAIPASLKRVYPLAMPMCLAAIPVQVRVLSRAGWHIGRDYVARLIAMLVLASINELLCLPERILAPLLARRRVKDPIFILGVHRSGTTHLHNLLALDPQLVAPRNHHVLNPLGALLFGWPMSGMLAAFLPWQRPMDAVQFHIFSANEEEFAIACESSLSPYWGWVFPTQGRAYDSFLLSDGFTPAERRRWLHVNRAFLRKLVFWSGRRPVLKNPCNTGRVALLLEMYPAARIVHIHRNPYDVYRSNMHFFREGHVLFQLQDPQPGDTYADRFLENYVAMENAFAQQTAALPSERLADVPFEELERDPIGVIRRLYEKLDLPLTLEFQRRLEQYLARIAGYKKNRFEPLPDTERAQVDAAVGRLARHWGHSS